MISLLIVAVFVFLLPGLLFSFRKPLNDLELPSAKRVQTPGGYISYSQMGEGPDLILIHGLGASAYSWRFIAHLLKTKFRITTFDLLGFGASEKPRGPKYDLDYHSENLISAINALQLKPVALVGSSMGGLLALWLAKISPTKFTKVVAIAPAIYGEKNFNLWPLKLIRFAEWTRPLLVNRWTLSWLVPKVVGTFKILNSQSIKNYLEPYRDPNSMQSFLLSLNSMADHRLPESLTGSTSPVLLIWGKSDAQVDQSVVKRARALFLNCKYVEVLSAHHPHEHIPEKISGLISEWILLDEHPEKPDQSPS